MKSDCDPTRRKTSVAVQVWMWLAVASLALFLCIEDPRWGSHRVLGSTDGGYGFGGPDGPFFIFVKTPDGKQHMFNVPAWELSRFREDVPVLLDVRPGAVSLHHPFGDWYYRTYLWMRWSAKRWFANDPSNFP